MPSFLPSSLSCHFFPAFLFVRFHFSSFSLSETLLMLAVAHFCCIACQGMTNESGLHSAARSMTPLLTFHRRACLKVPLCRSVWKAASSLTVMLAKCLMTKVIIVPIISPIRTLPSLYLKRATLKSLLLLLTFNWGTHVSQLVWIWKCQNWVKGYVIFLSLMKSQER